MRRAAIDIGGTFTDLVFWDDEAGRVVIHKLPSTPADPSQAGLDGLKALVSRAGCRPEDLDFLVHGTTIATNILLEKDGANVGLITTRGFRDVLHIGRKNRPYNFSYAQDVPRQSKPLVRRRARLPVTERIRAPGGEIEIPLDEDEVRVAARRLKQQGANAIAICCLMSFLNPVHENRIRQIVQEEYPDAFLSVSNEVAPVYREYERFSTTALNAYVGPKTASYLDRFSSSLEEMSFSAGLNLMTSGGGIVPSGEARKKPVSLLLSGPVGALIAGIEAGRQVGHPSVITLDVGGTSADIGVAPDGALRMKHLLDTRIGDYDAVMPMVDIATIGAGGGSIALVDEGGMFRVGPRSAGARPGPACYGLGGSEPTVTDAMVTLGWFRQEALRDSGLQIDAALARQAIQAHIARPLGLDLLSAAAGIYRIAINNMIEAIRLNSVSKGYDPRDFALVAYGGAGAAFVVEAAAQLAIPTIVIPPRPGVGAAAGLLSTDTRYEYRKTLWEDLRNTDHGRIEDAYAGLLERAREQLGRSGFKNGDTRVTHLAECRYAGQGYELTVEVPPPPVDTNWIEAVKQAFHEVHEQTYLRRFEDKPVMIINVGLAGIGRVPVLVNPAVALGGETPEAGAILDTRTVHFVEGNHAVGYETRFFDRDRLRVGNRIEGPAVIEQSDTTTVLTAATSAVVDDYGNLIVRFSGARHA